MESLPTEFSVLAADQEQTELELTEFSRLSKR